MKLHPSNNTGQKTFTAHGEGYVAVNGERFTRPILVSAGQVQRDWGAQDLATLTPLHFEQILSLAPEVVIFGTGTRQHFPPVQLYRSLIDAGISVEFMDTPAACRTYNILVAEDRKVIAAVLL